MTDYDKTIRKAENLGKYFECDTIDDYTTSITVYDGFMDRTIYYFDIDGNCIDKEEQSV